MSELSPDSYGISRILRNTNKPCMRMWGLFMGLFSAGVADFDRKGKAILLSLFPAIGDTFTNSFHYSLLVTDTTIAM
ncbi:MAG: hypothetical protein H7101_03745 [Deinococcales bacterium]|nr:hypothetical protein [Chitinophagaceae bacterium]